MTPPLRMYKTMAMCLENKLIISLNHNVIEKKKKKKKKNQTQKIQELTKTHNLIN